MQLKTMTHKTSTQPTNKVERSKQELAAEVKRREMEQKQEETAKRLDQLAEEVFIPKIKELCANPAEAEIEIRWMAMLLDGAVKRKITQLLNDMALKDMDLFDGVPKEQAEVVERLRTFQALLGSEGVEASKQFLDGLAGFINSSRVNATRDLTWNDISLEIKTEDVADDAATRAAQ